MKLVSSEINVNILKIECTDADNGATDVIGNTCASWYNDHPDTCGDYDDDDFTAYTMCCRCQTDGKYTLSFILKYT